MFYANRQLNRTKYQSIRLIVVFPILLLYSVLLNITSFKNLWIYSECYAQQLVVLSLRFHISSPFYIPTFIANFIPTTCREPLIDTYRMQHTSIALNPSFLKDSRASTIVAATIWPPPVGTYFSLFFWRFSYSGLSSFVWNYFSAVYNKNSRVSLQIFYTYFRNCQQWIASLAW